MSKIRPSTQIMPEGSPLQVLRINSAGNAVEAATLAAAATDAGGAIAAQNAPTSGSALWLAVDADDISISTVAADRTAVLSATVAWENGSVDEPTVWYDGTQWCMIYGAGWSTGALGYATAPAPEGPWTKYSGNPILGQGAGGVAYGVARPTVYVEAGTLYLYFPDNQNGGNLKVATGPDALHLTVQTATVLAPAGSALGIVNTAVVKDGSTYKMLFESSVSGGSWQMGYATATSPLGPFTIQQFPLSTLSRGGAYGGPWFAKRDDGTFVLLYHAATSGNLPSDIYRATSTDLLTWTQESAVFIGRVAPQEVDQTADPFYVSDGRGGYMFWSAQDNTTPSGSVMFSRAIVAPAPKWWDGKAWQPVLPTVQDEGTALTVRPTLDFVGAGVTATDDAANSRTVITIPGGSSTGAGELLMTNGVSNPPVPLTTEDGTDWLYQG